MLKAFLELLGLLESEENEFEEDILQEEQENRKQRILSSPRGQASLIICRQDNCLFHREALAKALQKGQIVIADLRNMEKESGQGILDFLSGVTCSIHGSVSRLCPGVFMASPRRYLVEEWEEPSEEEIDNEEFTMEGVEDGERTSHGS